MRSGSGVLPFRGQPFQVDISLGHFGADAPPCVKRHIQRGLEGVSGDGGGSVIP